MNKANHSNNVPDWDKEEVWIAIEANLDKPKRRRFIIVWLLLGTLCLLGLVYGISKLQHKHNKIYTVLEKNNKAALFDQTNHQSPSTKHVVRPDSSTTSKTGFNKTKSKRAIASPHHEILRDFDSLPRSSTEYRASVHMKAEDDKEQEPQLLKDKNNPSRTEKHFVDQETSKLIEYLPIGKYLLNSKNNLHFPNRTPILDPSDKNLKPWFLETSYMIGSQSHITNSSIEEINKYKSTQEQVAETHLAAIQGGYRYKSWSLSSGLAYERGTKWVSNTDTSWVRSYTVETDSAYVDHYNGQNIYLSGSTTVNEYKVRHIRNPNYIHRVYIPVSLSYHFTPVPLTISAGAYWNIWRHDEGYILSADVTVIDKNDKNKISQFYNQLAHRVSLSAKYDIYDFRVGTLGIQANVLYDINSHTSFMMEKYSSYYLGLHLRRTW